MKVGDVVRHKAGSYRVVMEAIQGDKAVPTLDSYTTPGDADGPLIRQ
jgi:hypothetical protein